MLDKKIRRGKKNKRSRKKRFKKQERQAKFAAKLRMQSKIKKTRKLKIQWKRLHYLFINFLGSNLFMNLQEIHGRSRWWTSSGLFGFKGRKRISYHSILGHVIKFIRRIAFAGNIYPFLVWKGIPKKHYRAVLKAIRYSKKQFPEISWQGSLAYLYIPFNGCRRRKLKRK